METITFNDNQRLLDLYRNLSSGDSVEVASAAKWYGVDEKTIECDIAIIKDYLKKNRVKSGEEQRRVFYYPNENAYRIGGTEIKRINEDELLVIAKILEESKQLTKQDMDILLEKIVINCASESSVKEMLEEIVYKQIDDETDDIEREEEKWVTVQLCPADVPAEKILRKLPMAKVVEQSGFGYLIEVDLLSHDVFPRLLALGDLCEVVKPKRVRQLMREKINLMNFLYTDFPDVSNDIKW